MGFTVFVANPRTNSGASLGLFGVALPFGIASIVNSAKAEHQL